MTLPSKHRILGIDPGSRTTGYGIIDSDGYHSEYITSGVINAGDVDMSERLHIMFCGVQELLNQFSPQVMAIEKVFVHRNADSALKLGQARGAVICAVKQIALPVFEYTPTEIKKSVVGKGHAAKEQVQHMMKMLLNLSASPKADAADALAVGLCHANTQQTLMRMSGVSGVHHGRLK